MKTKLLLNTILLLSFLIFSFAALLFVAHGNLFAPTESTENESELVTLRRTIVDPQNRQDSVFFGYVLGQSSKAATNSLLDEGKIEVEHRVPITIIKGGVFQNIYVEGYPFDLYIADKNYRAVLLLFDTNGKKIGFGSDEKLMSLQIYICSTKKAPIIEALKEQYGEPNTPPGDGYESSIPEEEIDAFWNVSNKAVYLATLGNFMVLVYEDIIAVRDKNNTDKAEAEAAKEAEKLRNMEQSKKMKL